MRLLVLASALASLAFAEVTLVRVWPSYRAAESFVGIGEYFGRGEATGGRLVLRSQPGERGGFYWLVRARVSAPSAPATIELSLLRSGETEPEVHRFPATLEPGTHVALVGLTGADWPDTSARPLAWRIRILDASDQSLATEQSFLWSAPTIESPAP